MHHHDTAPPASGFASLTGTVRGVRIPAAGPCQVVDLDAGHVLADLYEQIDCQQVEKVELSAGMDMWADEEGLLVKRALNRRATAIAHLFQVAIPARYRQPYVGTVMLLGYDATGDTASLSERTLVWLQDTLDRLDEALHPGAAIDDAEEDTEPDTDGEDDGEGSS